MRVIVIGGTGTIGRAVAEALSGRHEVVRVGHTRGDYQVDISSPDCIKHMYEWVAPFDAVVSAAGSARFRGLEWLSDEDLRFSIANKLMGQINLLRCGFLHMRDGGSFTLTSGVLAREPIAGSGAVSMVNAGIEGFASAAALQMPRGIRVNVVSPPWVRETLDAMGRDSAVGMPAVQVAKAYVESVESNRNGEVIDARVFADNGAEDGARAASEPIVLHGGHTSSEK